MSNWLKTGVLACVILAIAACSSDGGPRGKSPVAAARPDYARGKLVYNAHCSECHDDTESGAPMLDEPEDWSQRALALTSVLEAHAARGFLNMPGQASAGLTDQQVRDAVYYMKREISAGQ